MRNILAFANSAFAFFLFVFDIVSILGDSGSKEAIMSPEQFEALSMKQFMSSLIQHGCWKTRMFGRLHGAHLYDYKGQQF